MALLRALVSAADLPGRPASIVVGRFRLQRLVDTYSVRYRRVQFRPPRKSSAAVKLRTIWGTTRTSNSATSKSRTGAQQCTSNLPARGCCCRVAHDLVLLRPFRKLTGGTGPRWCSFRKRCFPRTAISHQGFVPDNHGSRNFRKCWSCGPSGDRRWTGYYRWTPRPRTKLPFCHFP